jgi:hypothetical protein
VFAKVRASNSWSSSILNIIAKYSTTWHICSIVR